MKKQGQDTMFKMQQSINEQLLKTKASTENLTLDINKMKSSYEEEIEFFRNETNKFKALYQDNYYNLTELEKAHSKLVASLGKEQDVIKSSRSIEKAEEVLPFDQDNKIYELGYLLLKILEIKEEKNLVDVLFAELEKENILKSSGYHNESEIEFVLVNKLSKILLERLNMYL